MKKPTVLVPLEELDLLKEEVARLKSKVAYWEWVNEMACENTPTKACECPGCETARDRAERGISGPEDEPC